LGPENRIIHSYDNIADDLIWSIVVNSLPKLKNEINTLLAENNSSSETQHELSSKENEKRLDAAIEKLKSSNSNSKNQLEE